MVTWRVILAATALAVVGGCLDHKPYQCAGSEQCARGDVVGVCEAAGYCSFDDASCPGGRRFEPNAGDGLGGQCVEPGGGACGNAVGVACCTDGSAPCSDNLFCDGGTCSACVTDVAHGRRHGCALEHDGTVWCFGINDDGQLGNGIAGGPPVPTPGQARENGTGAPIEDATAIGTGRDWACAIRTGGTVWCWGNNASGQLGNNTVVDSAAAVQVVIDVDGAPLEGIVAVQGGECNTCALDGAGGVWCWGCNGSGSLGDGTTVSRDAAAPVLTALAGPPLAGALQLAVGGGHACIESAGGEVSCWGQNNNGQVGDGTTVNVPFPLKVFDGEIATGRWHTCGVAPDQTVWCWGWGGHGRLANGIGWDPPDLPMPTQITTMPGGPPLTGARDVAAGAVSCALMTDGTAECWGDAPYGQTGVGTGTGSPLPVLDGHGDSLGGIQQIWAQHTRVCTLLDDGDVRCWGRNAEGELADPSLINHGFPTTIGLTCP